jgi:hypothetical protein
MASKGEVIGALSAAAFAASAASGLMTVTFDHATIAAVATVIATAAPMIWSSAKISFL